MFVHIACRDALVGMRVAVSRPCLFEVDLSLHPQQAAAHAACLNRIQINLSTTPRAARMSRSNGNRSFTPASFQHTPSDLGSNSGFVHDALACHSGRATPAFLPPPPCAMEALSDDACTGGGSTPDLLLGAGCDAAKQAVRAASPFAAESLKSASTAVSLSSSISADELQVCSRLHLGNTYGPLADIWQLAHVLSYCIEARHIIMSSCGGVHHAL